MKVRCKKCNYSYNIDELSSFSICPRCNFRMKIENKAREREKIKAISLDEKIYNIRQSMLSKNSSLECQYEIGDREIEKEIKEIQEELEKEDEKVIDKIITEQEKKLEEKISKIDKLDELLNGYLKDE